MLMRIAETISMRGTCTRAHVGAVLAIHNRIISTGYNGSPAGMAHCTHPYGEKEPCLTSVHAEANTVAFAAQQGNATDGATLYTTMTPCLPCAQLLVNAGVKRVVCGKQYRETAGVDLLVEAGIIVEVLQQ